MNLFRVLINDMPSELCLIDQNSEEARNLQSPDEKNIGAARCIAWEILCFPYAFFNVFYFYIPKAKKKKLRSVWKIVTCAWSILDLP